MAAAAVWKSSVLLTDLEDIQENLVFNIDKNLSTVSDQDGWIAQSMNWEILGHQGTLKFCRSSLGLRPKSGTSTVKINVLYPAISALFAISSPALGSS